MLQLERRRTHHYDLHATWTREQSSATRFAAHVEGSEFHFHDVSESVQFTCTPPPCLIREDNVEIINGSEPQHAQRKKSCHLREGSQRSQYRRHTSAVDQSTKCPVVPTDILGCSFSALHPRSSRGPSCTQRSPVRSLRQRTERSGGTMHPQASRKWSVTVSIP